MCSGLTTWDLTTCQRSHPLRRLILSQQTLIIYSFNLQVEHVHLPYHFAGLSYLGHCNFEVSWVQLPCHIRKSTIWHWSPSPLLLNNVSDPVSSFHCILWTLGVGVVPWMYQQRLKLLRFLIVFWLLVAFCNGLWNFFDESYTSMWV